MKKLHTMNLEELKAVATGEGITFAEDVKVGDLLSLIIKTRSNKVAIWGVRPALVTMHKMHNTSAMQERDVIGVGGTKAQFIAWRDYVRDLRDLVVQYVADKHDWRKTPEELKNSRSRIYPYWETLLEAGQISEFAEHFFLREEDVDSLVGFCENFMATDKGTVLTNTREMIFRKKVESLIGVRMAANMVLTDKDRDDLSVYMSAVASIDRINKALNGYTADDGTVVVGLLDKKKSCEERLSQMEALLKSANISDDEIAKNPMLVQARLEIKNIGKQISSNNESLKTAQETEQKMLTRATNIMATINEIEE